MDWPEQVRLRVGELRAVRLPGRSSGGYRWEAQVVSPDNAVSVAVVLAAQATVGLASRDEVLSLRGDAPGRATVHVTLARSWEPKPVERHTMVVIVEEPISTAQ